MGVAATGRMDWPRQPTRHYPSPAMPEHATLVIETSTPEASLCLVRPDGSVEERRFRSDRSHNAELFAPLQELVAGVPIGLVLVGSGPGSYSGTRVGISAAIGVAIAWDCPAVAVPSVLAIPAVAEGRSCLAVGDARRGTYWSARIEGRSMADPVLAETEPWAAALKHAAQEGCHLFSFEDPAKWPAPAGVRIEMVSPDAMLLESAWQAATPEVRAAWSAAVPQPLYLKPPHITKARSKPVDRP